MHTVSAILRRYFGARGPHLAAMLAYYALLSLFPFVFLAASLVSAIGRPEETSALLRDLSHVLPGTCAHDLARFVRSLESNAAEIGLIGGVALLWSSLGFLSALESGLNVLYGLPEPRLPAPEARHARPARHRADRPAARPHDRRHEPDGALARSRPASPTWPPGGSAAALAISTLTTFALPAARLPHAAQHRVTTRQVLPGRADRDRRSCRSRSRSLPLYVRSVEGLPGAEGVRRRGGAARLAVPDGQHRAARRRHHLVVGARARRGGEPRQRRSGARERERVGPGALLARDDHERAAGRHGDLRGRRAARARRPQRAPSLARIGSTPQLMPAPALCAAPRAPCLPRGTWTV